MANGSARIRQGDVYWLDPCPPLDDENEKDRPVVVVDDPKSLAAGGPVIVVACSRQFRKATDPDSVQLPDKGRIPQTKSGLKQPCWAVPRWHFPVDRERLKEHKGHLTGSVLKAVVAAYAARVLAAESDE